MIREPIEVFEYKSSEPVNLTAVEVSDLQSASRGKLSIEPFGDRYVITATSFIGQVSTPTVSVIIRPKLSLHQVMFMISYALNTRSWQHSMRPEFGEVDNVLEAVIPAYVAHVNTAIAPGLLQGYQETEEALLTVRGRIRVEEQIRRRFGQPFPIEVRYDEFTEDIELNRVLKATTKRLSLLRLRHPESAQALRSLSLVFSDITGVRYHRETPDFVWDRLNGRYQPAIDLAKLILEGTIPELKRGSSRSSAFLIDMNRVFETFVWTALREELKLTIAAFPKNTKKYGLWLDSQRDITLEPDLSWWQARKCVFVGDLKYKRLVGTAGNPDIYQMLAYTTATSLDRGLIIYGEGPTIPAFHTIPHTSKTIEVRALDLTGSPHEILASIKHMASDIRKLAGQLEEAA